MFFDTQCELTVPSHVFTTFFCTCVLFNTKYEINDSLLWCLTCRGRTQQGCSKYAAKKLSTTDSCSAADNDAAAEPLASSVAHDVAVGPCWANKSANSNDRTAVAIHFLRIFPVNRVLITFELLFFQNKN